MSKSIRFGAIAAGAVLALSSCGGSTYGGGGQSSGSQSKSATPGSGAALHVANTSLGNVLVDSHGMTVYLLASDKPNKSQCSAQCLTYWPAVSAPKAGANLPGVTGKVGSTKATDGTSMATVGGWPLYTSVNDKAPGDVTGEGVTAFGGVWYAVAPTGHGVKAKASSTPSSSSGGGGY
jgi:predicted lipoprotein with Yx(FWY)xxD motif